MVLLVTSRQLATVYPCVWPGHVSVCLSWCVLTFKYVFSCFIYPYHLICRLGPEGPRRPDFDPALIPALNMTVYPQLSHTTCSPHCLWPGCQRCQICSSCISNQLLPIEREGVREQKEEMRVVTIKCFWLNVIRGNSIRVGKKRKRKN